MNKPFSDKPFQDYGDPTPKPAPQVMNTHKTYSGEGIDIFPKPLTDDSGKIIRR